VEQPTPSSATVGAGGTARFTIPMISAMGIDGRIDFSCSGNPPNSTCAVSPNFVPPGNNPPPVTVSVHTSGPHGGNADSILGVDGILPFGVGIWASVVVLMVAVLSASQRLRRWHSWIMVESAIFAVSLCSCGGGVSGGPATPPGTYTITFTAKATNVT